MGRFECSARPPPHDDDAALFAEQFSLTAENDRCRSSQESRGPQLPAIPATTFCPTRICEPGRSTDQREPVTGCGCITLFTTCAPIWRPISVPTRVENR